MIRRGLSTGLRAAVLAAAAVAAPVSVGAQDAGDSMARARVTVVNDSGHPIRAVMTETPTASVVQPWPRALEAGDSMEAAFAYPAMSGALSMVQYALPPEADGDSRTCLFRWRTDASKLVRCAVVLTAQRIGVGAASCHARVVEQDARTCAFQAELTVR